MKKGDEIRTRILNAAEKLFTEKGFDNTTTRDIAQNSDLQHGNLYYYYKRKDDILLDILKLRMVSMFKFLGDRIESDDLFLMYPVFLRIFVDIFMIKPERIGLFIVSMTNNYLRDRVIDVYFQVYDFHFNNTNYDKEKIYIATIATVGLQSTLLVKFFRGELDMSKDEVCTLITKKTYAGIIPESLIDEYNEKSVIVKNKFFEKNISEYFKTLSYSPLVYDKRICANKKIGIWGQ
jgi:AcrR family transcriptional regulator